MLSQILFIFKGLFHPISQTLLYFKVASQDATLLNLGDLSRHQKYPACQRSQAEPTASAEIFYFTAPLCRATDNQKETCNTSFRSISGVLFPLK